MDHLIPLKVSAREVVFGLLFRMGASPCWCATGHKLGPWLFILMINDLRVSDLLAWKCVDNTIIAEMVPKGGRSNIQSAVSAIQD